MKSSSTLIKLLKRFWKHIFAYRKKQFGILIFLMIFVSIIEILSIGSVLPLLAVISAPARTLEHPITKYLIQYFELASPTELLQLLTIIFILITLITGALRLFLNWATISLSFETGADISNSIYRRTLYQPYAVHIARNSSEIINTVTSKSSGVIYNVIIPVLNLITACVMLGIIIVILLFIDPVISLLTFGGVGLIYGFIIRYTQKKLMIDGQLIAEESTRLIKSVQEGLGGIRDVLQSGSQDVFYRIFRDSELSLRRAQSSNLFISSTPRYVVEAMGMAFIAMLAYWISQRLESVGMTLPILGTLAVAFQRLLPLLHLAFGSWAVIKGGQASLQDTLELLDQVMPDYDDQPFPQPLTFMNNISLNQISFRYSPKDPWVIKNLNLSIAKGSRIGFVGPTGIGKSTLVDLIMGLLQPVEGTLEIDGQPITLINNRSWQACVAHVPQSIFLADTSIEKNIAFGVPDYEVDHELVRNVAKRAQISDIIESWPQKYKTFVGERGVQLSGGQRQRIGIARALYKQANVIILDEATSAIDFETEKSVIQAIESLGKDITMLIIAHRHTALVNCTQIIELVKDGGVHVVDHHEILRKELKQVHLNNLN